MHDDNGKKKAKRRTRFLGVAVMALIVIMAAALPGCGGQQGASSTTVTRDDVPVVKIAYLPITHALPVLEEAEQMAAASNGKYQIQLVKYGTWPELMDAVNSGQVDGASVLVELGMRAKEQGIDIRAVALGHRDGNVIVGSNEVASTADLKGKTIAIPARQSSHYILVLAALERAGLSESDVKITEMAPTEMPSALASKQIDAYCVAEPFGAKAVEVGVGHVLENSEDLWKDSLCCAFVLNGSFIDKNPELAKQVVKDYKAAGEKLEQTETALSVARTYLDQTDDTLNVSLQWIHYDNLDITKKTYNDLVKRVKKYGLSKNPPSYEQFVANLD